MTRRSFCFLFGAGVAGVMAFPSLASSALQAPVDAGTVLTQSLDGLSELTFSTRDASMVVGKQVDLSFGGSKLFGGTIVSVHQVPGGSRQVIAVDRSALMMPFDEMRRNGVLLEGGL